MTLATMGRLVVGALVIGILWVVPMWALAAYGAIVAIVQVAKFTAEGSDE